jgi:Rrf2 family protein
MGRTMWILSKKTRYALHGLAYIAVVSDGEPVAFETILAYLRTYSGRLALSPGYIAKIFQEVSRAGLIRAVSGRRGGYLLARAPGQIRIVEIVEALEGPLLAACCLLSVGNCPMEGSCGVRTMIHEAELTFHRFFERQTVQSLAEKMTFPTLPQVAVVDARRAEKKARPRAGAAKRTRR